MAEPMPIRVAHFPKTPGLDLPNHAIILHETVIREYDYRRDSIVLAINPKAVQPFVSWHRVVTSDSPTADGEFQVVDTCAWGHYHREIDTAWDNYQLRVQEQSAKLDPDDGNDLDS